MLFRSVSGYEGPRKDWAEEMPVVSMTTIDDFRRFWKKAPFFLDSGTKFRYREINTSIQVIEVPFRYVWPDQTPSKGRFWFPFVAVKRGSFWWLANGFFWPSTEHKEKATD